MQAITDADEDDRNEQVLAKQLHEIFGSPFNLKKMSELLTSTLTSDVKSFIRQFRYLAETGLSGVSLHNVDLSTSNLNVKAITYSIQLCNRIVDIQMTGCYLGKTLGTLDPIIDVSSKIRRLNLRDNELGPDECAVLASALENNPSITELDLSRNNLVGIHVRRGRVEGNTDLSGLEELLVRLHNNKTLTSFDLSSNYLGGVYTAPTAITGTALADAPLRFQLREPYSEQMVELLEALLVKNLSIVTMNLQDNGFEDELELAARLVTACRQNRVCSSLLGKDFSSFMQSKASSSLSSSLSASSSSSSLSDINLNLEKDFNADFSNSRMTPFTARLFPAERFLSLPQVTCLDLSGNLELASAGLNALLSGLVTVKPLYFTKLNLRRTMLDGSCILALAAFIKQAHAPLKSLDLSENPELGSREILALLGSIGNNDSIEELFLEDMGLTDKTVESIATCIGRMKALRRLELQGNAITCIGVWFIANNQTLRARNSIISTIGLSRNQITDNGPRQMANFLASNNSLQSLDMSWNAMCGDRKAHTYDPAPIIQLATILKESNRSLTTLNLSYCDIGARSTKCLMEALSLNTVLHTLVLIRCNVSEVGSISVGEALPELKGLRTLIMSDCMAGPLGGERLLVGLRDNTSLTYVDLARNELTGYIIEGATPDTPDNYDFLALCAVATCLEANKTLTHLDISENRLFKLPLKAFHRSKEEMFSAAVTRLAAAIVTNGKNGGKLTTLNLLGNRMRSCVHHPPKTYTDNWLQQCACNQCAASSSVRDLIAAREGHPNLKSLFGVEPGHTSLTITNNKAEALVARILASELAYNHVLKHVDLTVNSSIELGGISVLARSICTNVCLRSLSLPPDRHAHWELLEEMQLKSFNFRVALAVFMRGCSFLGHAPLRMILEYAIGEGPQMQRYLSYRGQSSSSSNSSSIASTNASGNYHHYQHQSVRFAGHSYITSDMTE